MSSEPGCPSKGSNCVKTVAGWAVLQAPSSRTPSRVTGSRILSARIVGRAESGALSPRGSWGEAGEVKKREEKSRAAGKEIPARFCILQPHAFMVLARSCPILDRRSGPTHPSVRGIKCIKKMTIGNCEVLRRASLRLRWREAQLRERPAKDKEVILWKSRDILPVWPR